LHGLHDATAEERLTMGSPEEPQMAVRHIITAVKPETLRTRLEQDISLMHAHLKKDFLGFVKHGTEVSEAYDKIY